MPLIEIINITLLAFSVGLLSLMGISYLVYRYKESSHQKSIYKENISFQVTPKENIKLDIQTLEDELKSKNNTAFYLAKTYFIQPTLNKEKFSVVNKNIPSLKRTHSPKFIYLVNYSEKE